MKRRLPVVLAAGWAVLAGWSFAARVGRLAQAAPTLAAPPAERAAIESGDPAFHAFLQAVRAALRPGERAAIWVADPAGELSYATYRARFELFPAGVAVLAGPRRGAPPPGAAVLGEYRRGDPAWRVRRR